MNCLVFDIETVPDVELGRRILGVDGVDDKHVAQVLSQRREEATGSDMLPLEQQRVVAISALMRTNDVIKVWSLGDPQSSEKEIIERFFEGIEKFSPTLVSWNGSGFDLPVLHYRALKYGVRAPRYWETGDGDTNFRWNNYLGRFHWRHTDVMDVLSGYQGRGRASLQNIALMLGLPGKLGMSGGQVWDQYCAGNLQGIRDYCETDVINTYLIYLRFQLMRGRLPLADYGAEVQMLREYLAAEKKPHFKQYLDAWPSSSVKD